MHSELLMGISEWIQIHRNTLEWLGFWSLITFVGTLVIVPVLVVRVSDDYFLAENPKDRLFRSQYPAIRYVFLILKNVLGAVFVLVGFALLFLPGQGLITIFIGVVLMDFPRKRALELRIIRQTSILKSINWIRARARRPPLRLPRRKKRR
ncbi:MAG: PGPGW domain-containing protein [Desulfomonilia bacterium]|nr:PGPGW domain-containing protein [Desulfomonilia bacterium]